MTQNSLNTIPKRRATKTGSSFLILIFTLLISACIQTPNNLSNQSNPPLQIGAIIPHHLLVESQINSIYKKIHDELPRNQSFEIIILLSPNHFGLEIPPIQTTQITEKPPGKTLINWDTFDPPNLDLTNINNLNRTKIAIANNKNFNLEHGISSHYKFLNLYFPKAKIIPITLKRNIKETQLNKLNTALNSLNSNNTLIIASIDFSHYCEEKLSFQDDQKIINFTKSWRKSPSINTLEKTTNLALSSCHPKPTIIKDPRSDMIPVAMDSPETLYVFLKLMESKNLTNPEILNRTSTLTLTTLKDPKINTSHLYAIFK